MSTALLRLELSRPKFPIPMRGNEAFGLHDLCGHRRRFRSP